QPLKATSKEAAVLICPGGGYYLLAWDWEGVDIARYFVHQGYTVGVLRSRLPHWESEACRSKVALMDAQRGMQLFRSMSSQLGFAKDKVALMGFSAGGHLAASAAVHHKAADPTSSDPIDAFSSRPDLSILVYPVISTDTIKAGHGGSIRNLLGQQPDPGLIEYYSIEKQVTKETPPTFLAHADDDAVVVPENSILYYQALHRAGVPAALHIYSQGEHGFAAGRHLTGDTIGWLEDLMRWLGMYW
ncbi:MAG: alpha/beta hydrolase, partial [Bacteroidota bacterium]